MGDAYKILGQLNVASAGLYETLYTCPVPTALSITIGGGAAEPRPLSVDQNTWTTVTSILVCHTDGGASETFSIRLLPTAATSPGLEHDIFVSTSIGAFETKVLSLGLVLSAGNTISVTCDTTNHISFTAMGIETT